MTISVYEIDGIAGIAWIEVGLVHSEFWKLIDLVSKMENYLSLTITGANGNEMTNEKTDRNVSKFQYLFGERE